MNRITIKQRVLALSLCVLSLLLFIGAFSFFTDKATKNEIEQQVMLSALLRNSMDADMHHDAIRADVLQAMRAMDQNDAQDLERMRKDFKEDADAFLKDISEIVNKIPSTDLRNEYKNVYTALLDYIRCAKAIIVDPIQRNEINDRYHTFYASFKNMERLLDQSGLHIESYEKMKAQTMGRDLKERTLFVAISQGLGVCMFLFMVILILKKVISPIHKLEETMIRIAAGDKGLDIPFLDNQVEIGNMARACEQFKQLVLTTERLQNEQKEKAREAETNLKQQMLLLTDEIEKEMRETISQVMENTHTVLAISDELRESSLGVATQSEEVSQATERAKQNVDIVAKATGELSVSVNEISQQVSHAAATAQTAVETAHSTNETVHKLADAVRTVGDVVQLISDIAEQTNLLALNATIEAARAGEAGKGFAVVAAEVKNLANQTTKATDSITHQISSIQQATADAVQAINKIVLTIQDINNTSTSIATAVEEQGAATREISINTQEVAQGTRDVSEKITHVNLAFQRSNTLSFKVKETTDEVMKHITTLRNSMVEILRNSYAGNRRSSPRFETQNFSTTASFHGKSYTCAVKDISYEGIAIFSKEMAQVISSGDSVVLELSGHTNAITGIVCGIATGEIIRLAFRMDDKQHAAITRFVKSRFNTSQDTQVA